MLLVGCLVQDWVIGLWSVFLCLFLITQRAVYKSPPPPSAARIWARVSSGQMQAGSGVGAWVFPLSFASVPGRALILCGPCAHTLQTLSYQILLSYPIWQRCRLQLREINGHNWDWSPGFLNPKAIVKTTGLSCVHCICVLSRQHLLPDAILGRGVLG